MPHPGTAPETVQVLHAFARRIGQVPLVSKKESPKYVVNAILGAINDVALRLVADGVAAWAGHSAAVVGVLELTGSPLRASSCGREPAKG
jgi:3-hydroxybutyryl-CoA dehydrogenase